MSRPTSIFKTLALIVGLAGLCAATSLTYYKVIASNAAVTANTNYTVDLNQVILGGARSVSAQAAYKVSGSTIAYVAPAGFVWYGSNDNVNFNAVNVATATYTSISTTTVTSSLWDFGAVNYRYLELAVSKPTGGTLSLTVTVNAKN